MDSELAEDLPADVVAGGTPGKKGDRSPFVPKVTASASVEYEHPVSEDVSVYGLGSANYRGASFSAFRPVTAADIAAGADDNYYSKLPSYVLLDLRAGFRTGRYDINVFVDNVTNEVTYSGLNANIDATRVYSARPRTVGVGMSARF